VLTSVCLSARGHVGEASSDLALESCSGEVGGGTTGQHGASSGLFHTLSLGAHNSPVKAGSISPHADVKYG
jgi:hypothetical protein